MASLFIVICLAVGWLCYRFIERPMTILLNGHLVTSSPSKPGVRKVAHVSG